MYEFSGKKCRIHGCDGPAIYSTLGLCQSHYNRFKLGRLAEDGSLLPLPVRTKICEACGKEFELNPKANHVKWCIDCRKAERAKTARGNQHGVYKRSESKRVEKMTKRYIHTVLVKIIKECRGKSKYRPILDMRSAGMTYAAIGERVNLTRQRIQQICDRY